MRKLLGMAVAAAVFAAVAAVQAGDVTLSCCSGDKDGDACCGEMSTKLNLTKDQEARIALLNSNLRRATSRSERLAMFTEGMQRILTADQFSQWSSASRAMARNGTCPLLSTDSGDKGNGSKSS